MTQIQSKKEPISSPYIQGYIEDKQARDERLRKAAKKFVEKTDNVGIWRRVQCCEICQEYPQYVIQHEFKQVSLCQGCAVRVKDVERKNNGY